jgi:hypothetical protein
VGSWLAMSPPAWIYCKNIVKAAYLRCGNDSL